MQTYHVVIPASGSERRSRSTPVAAAFAIGMVLAVALVASRGSEPKDTKLAMMGDIATLNDIHSAYIHGSIPTAKGESDDIMDLNFPDERNGADSKAYQPSAYVRGSVDTFKAEASDITSRSATHGVMAHKDLKTESLMSLPAKQNHLSKLAMMGDIATLNDIHSAYIHGSIPTAKGESDDIMDLNFPDERNGADSKAYQPSAYVRGSVDTFKAEASDITSRSATHGVMAHKDLKTESLMSLPAKQNHLSKLAMMGDIATLNDIHSAYIHGSIPTAKGESDDIMDLNFPDERNGADSKAYQPSAYVRGSVDTFKAEASDITSRSATHGVMAHKDLKTESLMSLPARQQALAALKRLSMGKLAGPAL